MDYLQPLHDMGRPEHILIEMDGYIFPIAEILLYGVRTASPEIQEKFPKYHDFDNVEDWDQFYHEFAFHSAESFLQRLADKAFSDKELHDYAEQIYATVDDPIFFLHETVIHYGLPEILNSHFCRKVYLFSQREIRPWEVQYIMKSLKIDKTEIVYGDILEFIQDHPELTTLMLNHTSDCLEILENPEKYQLKNAMIFLRYSDDTICISNGSTQSEVAITFNHGEKIARLTEPKGNKVDWLPIDCIPTNPLQEPLGDPVG